MPRTRGKHFEQLLRYSACRTIRSSKQAVAAIEWKFAGAICIQAMSLSKERIPNTLWAIRASCLTRQWAYLDVLNIVGVVDSIIVLHSHGSEHCRVRVLGENRLHDCMKDWTCSGDATDLVHGRSVKIADPHSSGHALRIANYPVVAIALGRASFGGNLGIESQRGLEAKARSACSIVSKYVR